MRDPRFTHRIIGDVRLRDSKAKLRRSLDAEVSLRADEGSPFFVGTIERMGLARSSTRSRGRAFGLVTTPASAGAPSCTLGPPPRPRPRAQQEEAFDEATVTGDDVSVGAYSVVFRANVGSRSSIGARSVVQQSILKEGTRVPSRTIYLQNKVFGKVEW